MEHVIRRIYSETGEQETIVCHQLNNRRILARYNGWLSEEEVIEKFEGKVKGNG